MKLLMALFLNFVIYVKENLITIRIQLK